MYLTNEEQDLIWQGLPNQIKKKITREYLSDIEYYDSCGCELTHGAIIAVEDLFGANNLKKS